MNNIKKLIFITIVIGKYTMANMDLKIEEIVKKHKIPSMSVMVLDNDKIALQSFFGVRKIGSKDQVTKNDSFHLGSCGKAFTATLVLKLMDEGKLNIEDPIIKYIPSLDSKKFSDIKIKDLLSHAGGIPGNVGGQLWIDMFSFDITPEKGRDLAIQFLRTAEREDEAGAKFLYSNLGYIALGKIVETLEKKSFEEVLQEKIFKPFQMTSCTFGPAGRGKDLNVPWPHRFENDKYIPMDPNSISADNPPSITPAGGVSCNQEDWAKFIYFVMDEGAMKNFLSPSSRKFLTMTNLADYTYGAWGRMENQWASTLLTHAGSNTMNYAYAIVGIDKKFAFLINTNSAAEEAVKEVVPLLKDFYLSLSNK